jgi:predicted transcriptional regulator
LHQGNDRGSKDLISRGKSVYISINMKAIQITVDERLLKEVDATDEARRDGRSAVFRRAVAEYLSRRRAQSIAERYRRAYGDDAGLGDEFAGWEDEGQWPAE